MQINETEPLSGPGPGEDPKDLRVKSQRRLHQSINMLGFRVPEDDDDEEEEWEHKHTHYEGTWQGRYVAISVEHEFENGPFTEVQFYMERLYDEEDLPSGRTYNIDPEIMQTQYPDWFRALKSQYDYFERHKELKTSNRGIMSSDRNLVRQFVQFRPQSILLPNSLRDILNLIEAEAVALEDSFKELAPLRVRIAMGLAEGFGARLRIRRFFFHSKLSLYLTLAVGGVYWLARLW